MNEGESSHCPIKGQITQKHGLETNSKSCMKLPIKEKRKKGEREREREGKGEGRFILIYTLKNEY